MYRTVIRLLERGFKDLVVNPWAQVLTLVAVILVSFLGGLFLLFLHNLDMELQRVRGDVMYQVYWAPKSDLKAVKKQWEEFKKLDYLTDLKTFTPGEALEELSKQLGGEVETEWIRAQSPLPATALLAFTPPTNMGEKTRVSWAKALEATLKSLKGVDSVHENQLGPGLADSWGKTSRRIFWPIFIFLCLVLALVVGNTIKLSLLSKRDEIEILKLVGAKNWYIQLPLLVNGAFHGLLGSILAMILLKVTQSSFSDFLNFPPLFLELSFLPSEQVFLLIFVLTAVSVGSSLAAVRMKGLDRV